MDFGHAYFCVLWILQGKSYAAEVGVQVGTTDADPSGGEQEGHLMDKIPDDAHEGQNENTDPSMGSTTVDADDEGVAPLRRLRARAPTFVSTSLDVISTQKIVPTPSTVVSGKHVRSLNY